MRRWIEFNVRHPKIIIGLLLIITAVSFRGMKNLYFDGSTDVLMPKDDPVYLMGQLDKKEFGDSKTFMLTAVEPAEGEELFSHKVFSHLNLLVKEIEEFRDFNLPEENRRLNVLTSLGKIGVKSGKKLKVADINQTGKNSFESSIDEEIFGDSDQLNEKSKLVKPQQKHKEDFYVRAIRQRNQYSYEAYGGVKLEILKREMGEKALPELETVLQMNDFGKLASDHIFTKEEYIKILETFEEAYLFKSMEIVKTFMNPISGEDIRGTESELKPVDLIPVDNNGTRIIPENRVDFEKYKKKLLLNPANRSNLYSVDGEGNFRALAFSIFLRPMKDYNKVFRHLCSVIEKFNHSPVLLTSVGSPVYQKYITDYMKKDMKRFMPFVILVVLLTFYFNFRSLRGIVLPALCVILGMIWTMGLIGFMGIPITILINIMPAVLIAVGSSYSIHVFNQYLHDQESIRQKGRKAGLTESISHISVTVLLASLTTFIGFMTLSLNQVTSLQQVGIFSAVGSALAALIAIMVMPSFLVLMNLMPAKEDKGVNEKHNNMLVRTIVSLSEKLSIKHPGAVIICFSILIVVFIIGISKVKIETSPLYNFKDDSYIVKSDERISDLFDGAMAVNLVIDTGKKNGVIEPGFLKLTEDIRQWIVSGNGRDKYHHMTTFAFGDVIKRMHKAMNNENPNYYCIPEDKTIINDYLQLYSDEDRDSDGRIDKFERFVDQDFRKANIMVRTGSRDGIPISSTILLAGMQRIDSYLENHPVVSGWHWHITGECMNYAALNNYVARGQIITIVLTLVLIFFVILILSGSLKAASISLLPISVSIVIVYGIMGFLEIPVDITKSLLAAITIGIGIDDTIHMLKTIRFNLSKGMALNDALKASFREAGMAIVYTSIALILGFSVFMFSEFKPVFYFGWLIVFNMIATTFAAMVLLPSVVSFFNIELAGEKEEESLKSLKSAQMLSFDEE